MNDIVIIGGGLTGLTTSFLLKNLGQNVTILEKENSIGGSIHTYRQDGYIFEGGPNTGVISNPETAELFELLGIEPEIANSEAEKRLILKKRKWYPLPNGPVSFIKTPLFSITDKIRIAFEPLRKKGTDPHESVASLAARRIGRSFVDYAVNPFISGIYAGDPELLVTKYALPKLYNLEQVHGSFIKGAFNKSREEKTERDLKASRKVFSVRGGLGKLIDALKKEIGEKNIICNADRTIVEKNSKGKYRITYYTGYKRTAIEADVVISTVGSYALPALFPFIPSSDMENLVNINYAKVVQVAVALNANSLKEKYRSFGGLIPKKENRKLLGVLFPSYCFSNRAPENCSMLAVYLGGIKSPQLFELSDKEIDYLVRKELNDLFEIAPQSIRFTRIFKHRYAIPQYEESSGKRFDAIKKIEQENPGLIIAGNLRDGIGMADRIKQAFSIIEQLGYSL